MLNFQLSMFRSKIWMTLFNDVFYLKWNDILMHLWIYFANHILSMIEIKLIIKSSFELTFWTQIEIESSYSHFQLNLSQVTYIFNLMQLNLTENWVNLTWFIKNLSLMSRELNIENFPIFDFCIIFLHYLFALSFNKELWRET